MPAEMKEIIAQAAQRLIMEKRVKKLTVKDIVEDLSGWRSNRRSI